MQENQYSHRTPKDIGEEVKTISIVVPAYNEREVLPEFHRRLTKVILGMHVYAEIIYVNDGSTDNTSRVLQDLWRDDNRVVVLELSRNFGKEIALTAGIDHAVGDVVVVIDADLQDPPEVIPKLFEKWQAGYDIVYAQRSERSGESWVKKTTASIFYRLIQHVGRVEIPKDTGDFRLLSRRAVDALMQLRETHRFMKGLFSWIGFPQAAILYSRDPRYAGTTKWNYWKLWNFAIEGVTSFTVTPLKIATYIGTITAVGAFLYGLQIIVTTLWLGRDVPGYASLMVAILFIGGIQLIGLGFIGEYLGRVFNETKGRPLYFIYRHLRATESTRHKEETGMEPVSPE